jgi:hypothetical protein
VVTQADAVDLAPRTNADPATLATQRLQTSPVFRIGVLVLVLLTAIWRFWTLSSWSWFQDDWVYLTRTTELPFWQYISQNYNGHLMPGQFVVAWVITKAAPLDHSYAVATTVFFVVASLVAWAAALRTIFGERARLLYPMVILALSPLFMPISLWWAAAMQVFPLQLAMGLSVLFVARYMMYGHRRRDLVGLSLSYAFGLFFWQKALLVFVPIVFVALLLSHGALGERLRSAWRVVWAPLALSLAYIPVYVGLTRSENASRPELFVARSLSETLDFFLKGILDVGMPALFGGPWSSLSNTGEAYSSGSGVVTLALIALGILGTIAAVRLRHQGGLALAMAATYAVVSWGLLFTSSRFDVLGVFSVRDARYAADIVPVALLMVTFLVSPTLVEDRSSWLRLPRTGGRVLHRWRAGAAVLLALVTVSTVYTTGRNWDTSAPSSPKEWVDDLTADAAGAGGSSVHDSLAPNHVIFGAYFPRDARLSQMLKPLALPLRYNQPAEQMFMADWAGHLMEVDVEATTRAVSPPPVEGCGYLVDAGRTTVIPLEPGLYNWEWGYQLSYFSGEPALVTVRTDTRSVDLRLDRGLHQIQFVVEDAASQLRVTGHPDSSPVCVTEVRAGSLKPSERWIGDLNRP